MNNVGGALAVLPLQELPKETFSSKFNCIKFKFMKWYPSLLAINNFTGSEKFWDNIYTSRYMATKNFFHGNINLTLKFQLLCYK